MKEKRKILWCLVGSMLLFAGCKEVKKTPEEILTQYIACLGKQEYEEMYSLTTKETAQEKFIQRNSAIYEGMEAEHYVLELLHYDEKSKCVTYALTFDTIAGEVTSICEAYFQEKEEGYRIVWDDAMIFPELTGDDKVRISTTEAKRGQILDRDGRMLAGPGIASSVGLVPGRMAEKEDTVNQIAKLLEVEPESIMKKLDAAWVKDDSFVPIKTVPKVKDLDLMAVNVADEVLVEQKRQQQLMEISGVMISDIEVREYPLGEAAAHLIGYVQPVTAEDLEEHAGEGYTVTSVIGRNGMEGLYEERLKGENGCRIYIEDANGVEKDEIACVLVEDGENVQLSIDSALQQNLYEQFQEDKGCSIAMDPYTGEVLALVSTPSYDNNDFILGLSNEQWEDLNENEDQPMYNRFRQCWCPGSTFKPMMAAIGLETRTIETAKDYGNEGLRWQKDASWGDYFVTTLHEYEPVTLENALIYSDNIYFAKAALRTGEQALQSALEKFGFCKELPFEIKMGISQYSNTEKIETEIQLADSGYGQGEILMNPLHLACLYTGFLNQGNVIKPQLEYQENKDSEIWIEHAFSAETANVVKECLEKVVNDPDGTGYGAHRDDILLGGKTGTAEIKISQGDEDGTELGWFSVFTLDDSVEQPVLLISMAEDVKERGGSSYVVGKVREVLEKWLVSKPQEIKPLEGSVMGLVQDLYMQAKPEDVYETALPEEIILKMRDKVAETKSPVYTLIPYSEMKNYEVFDAFLNRCKDGISGSIKTYQIRFDGGIATREYWFDGKDLYVSNVNEIWNRNHEPAVIHESCTQLNWWDYTEKGSFCYQLSTPNEQNLSEIVDESNVIRVKPLSTEQRTYTLQCVSEIGYQGNNLLRSNWDTEHMNNLDYNGLYQYLYEIKSGNSFPTSTYSKGIPAEEFESLLMEYLPVTKEQLREYAIFDGVTEQYRWQQVNRADYFDTAYPEVTNVRKNDDGTVTLTVDAVCDMVICDDTVIRSELTVRFLDDGSFRYLGNQIVNDYVIPEYRYRFSRDNH